MWRRVRVMAGRPETHDGEEPKDWAPDERNFELPEDAQGEAAGDESAGEGEAAGDEFAGEGESDNPASEGFPRRPMRVSPAFDLSGVVNLPDFSKLMQPVLPDLRKMLNLPDFSGLMPTGNLAERVIPALDLSGLVQKIDYASLFPKIELTAPIFDFSTVLPKIALPDFGPAFAALLKRMRESLPPNWPADIDLDRVVAVIQDDGLPLVWVPRAEVVVEVMAATDRSARIEVLVAHFDELVADCREVLTSVGHETLTGQLPLARRAVDALEAGHHEAAQALAVVVTETAVARAISDKYADVKKQVLFDPDLVAYTQLRLRAALAPIGRFYTTWYASSGQPAPEALSRHVTVHQADYSHYTPGNATVAVLLAVSVLRALQELQELSEASEEDERSA
jgi:hypothetical protein